MAATVIGVIILNSLRGLYDEFAALQAPTNETDSSDDDAGSGDAGTGAEQVLDGTGTEDLSLGARAEQLLILFAFSMGVVFMAFCVRTLLSRLVVAWNEWRRRAALARAAAQDEQTGTVMTPP